MNCPASIRNMLDLERVIICEGTEYILGRVVSKGLAGVATFYSTCQ